MAKHPVELLNFTNMGMGTKTVGELVRHAVAHRLDAVAVCDFNTMQAFPALDRECRRHGLKAVYGVIFPVRPPEGVPLEVVEIEVICFAKDQQGLEALYRLYNGRIPQSHGPARPEADALRAERQHLLLGLRPFHDKKVMSALREITETMFLPDFAILDSEMTKYGQWEQAYALLTEKQIPLCVTARTGDFLSMTAEPEDLLRRFAFLGQEAAEKAIRQAGLLAEQVDMRIEPLPRSLPDRQTIEAEVWIQETCLRRLQEVYGTSETVEAYKEQLAKELRELCGRNLAMRFRIAMEIMDYCKERGEQAAVTSSCCPLISYLLGLSDSIDLPSRAPWPPTLTMKFPPTLRSELIAHLDRVFPAHQLLRVSSDRTPNAFTLFPRETVLPLEEQNGEKVIHFALRDLLLSRSA